MSGADVSCERALNRVYNRIPHYGHLPYFYLSIEYGIQYKEPSLCYEDFPCFVRGFIMRVRPNLFVYFLQKQNIKGNFVKNKGTFHSLFDFHKMRDRFYLFIFLLLCFKFVKRPCFIKTPCE